MQLVDNFLNRITMYRLVLYGLSAMTAYALVLSLSGIIPYSFDQLVSSLIVLSAICYASNFLFSRFFGAITNFESSIITTLILFLILTPMQSFADAPVIIATGVVAMLSKYLFAIRAKHIFNPAAIALVIMGIFGSPTAEWWVGSITMLPIVAIIGFLIVRKIRRFQMVGIFLMVSLLFIVGMSTLQGEDFASSLMTAFVSWPIIFFATIMLTEPLTSPPTKKLQLIYGGLVGILFTAQFHVGPLFSTPELALVIGNLFSYAVSSKQKLFLHLQKKKELAPDVYEFAFEKGEPFNYQPGQYLEWTVADKAPDSRGNRRYFTIASSPTEKELKLGIRFSKDGSKFKDKLLHLNKQTIVASQLAGDFVLPSDPQKKLAFIAGGIGVTPFRSMIKYLVDKKEERSILLLYANRSVEHIVYKDLFDDAAKVIGLKTHYIATDKEHVPSSWKGLVGRIDTTMLAQVIPDYHERIFYLSGPNAMVTSYKKLLLSMGVKSSQIITDYFPGF